MSKLPFQKIPNDYGGWYYKPIELTGKCKRITYPSGNVYEYAQCQRRLFGIKLGTFWVYKDSIVWSEQKKVEYYDCNLTENT